MRERMTPETFAARAGCLPIEAASVAWSRRDRSTGKGFADKILAPSSCRSDSDRRSAVSIGAIS
jgi:predicted outer membrane protein